MYTILVKLKRKYLSNISVVPESNELGVDVGLLDDSMQVVQDVLHVPHLRVVVHPQHLVLRLVLSDRPVLQIKSV